MGKPKGSKNIVITASEQENFLDKIIEYKIKVRIDYRPDSKNKLYIVPDDVKTLVELVGKADYYIINNGFQNASKKLRKRYQQWRKLTKEFIAPYNAVQQGLEDQIINVFKQMYQDDEATEAETQAKKRIEEAEHENKPKETS